MIVKMDDEIMELIQKEPMKTFVVLKVLGSASLYSVSGKMYTEEQVEEFIKTMFQQISPEEETYSVRPEELN